MYGGLPLAGILANQLSQRRLAPHGYCPVPIMPGLWKHDTKDVYFTLVVDDFGVKYTQRADAEHLMHTLTQVGYKVSEEWNGTRYCGFTLAWDYVNHHVTLSMPGYVERALQRFRHPKPTRSEHSPHTWNHPYNGAKVQYSPDPDNSPFLDAANKKTDVQEVLGTFLFYARAVDVTLLKAIGSLATQQPNPTETTMEGIVKLLNYAALHPDAKLRYHASGMILWVDSDARYLSESKSRSKCAGYHFLSNQPRDPSKPPQLNDAEPMHNAPVHVMCTIMKEVVSVASEAELAGLFHNGKDAFPVRTCLAKLGHPQPPTPLKTDITTAEGHADDTVKQKQSKAIDMRFCWIRDRVRQGQYHVYWRKADFNRADYFTKHHSTRHHQNTRHEYLHQSNQARNENYYELLTPTENDDDAKDTLSAIQFAPDVQTCSFDSSMVCHIDTVPSCEGVLIPGFPCIPDLQSQDIGDVIESRLASKAAVAAANCRSTARIQILTSPISSF